MRPVRVLIAHSDLGLQRKFEYLCQKAAPCESRCFSKGHQALDTAMEWLPDLIIVGHKLVGLEGLQLCYRVRRIRQFAQTPLLMALGQAEREAKYQAYQAGVDDVVTLPLDDLEFVYRLKIHLRRHRIDQTIQCGDFSINPESEKVSRDGQDLELTPSEFSILSLLLQNPERIFSTEDLLVEALGSPPQLGNPQVIHTHVRNLRRKLEPDPRHPIYICHIHRGYQWGAN